MDFPLRGSLFGIDVGRFEDVKGIDPVDLLLFFSERLSPNTISGPSGGVMNRFKDRFTSRVGVQTVALACLLLAHDGYIIMTTAMQSTNGNLEVMEVYFFK